MNAQPKSDSPRTDAAFAGGLHLQDDWMNLARTLERELAEHETINGRLQIRIRDVLSGLRIANETADQFERENAELRAALEAMLSDCGQHNVGCKEYPPGYDDSRCCPVHIARAALVQP